jgi:hypothetical protein
VTLADLVAFQAEQCDRAGSPLYGRILRHVLEDVRSGGVVAEVLAGHEQDPLGSALVLRLMGGVHRIVLEGRAPVLAACYPSTGGDPFVDDVGERFVATVREHRDEVVRRLAEGVQTNEVGRSGVLVGGYARVAEHTGLPLRVLEMGTSAGLNLRWDAFAYDTGTGWCGDPDSPVRFGGLWDGGPGPDLPDRIAVAERRGCDPSPIDPLSEDGRMRLRSFVWPDQVDRRARLDAAMEVAARVPAEVDQADGPTWLAERLAEPAPGLATVAVHSIVLQYLPRERRPEVRQVLAAAGARATPDAPVAWLRLEPAGDVAELRLTMWPEGREEVLATSGFHGPPSRWVASRASRG